jgi:hypothetical protein
MTDEELIVGLKRIGKRVSLPCPDGLEGCLVHHFGSETNPVAARAIDRIEALTAENEALKKSGRALLNAKHKEAAEEKLWFEKGQALTAENERLRKALGHIALGFTIELDDEDGPVQVWLDGEDMSSLAQAALEKQP